MITKIVGEQPFQVLTSNFSISPSNEGYTLQISADGKQYSNLFTVGAGVTRLVTGVAANSYYRLSGNQSEVSINWMKTCVTDGGGSGTELQPVADFPLNAVEGTVISYTGSSSASGVYQYDGNEWTEVGADIDLSAYWTSVETQSALTAVEDHLFDVEQVTASALTELHDDILELSARTGGNSNIIPAITTQAEYEAISGDVKTGDLIVVEGVDINDDGYGDYGLFRAYVEEQEDQGVITRMISWERRDNGDSLQYSGKDYPWMVDNGVLPIDLGNGAFLISSDFAAEEDEAYNGIGFDDDGKPVTTHIVPHYDEETGEVTGMTREDTPIGTADFLDDEDGLVISTALNDLKNTKVSSSSVSTIWKGTQAEYDAIVTKDPATFYIIVSSN